MEHHTGDPGKNAILTAVIGYLGSFHVVDSRECIFWATDHVLISVENPTRRGICT